MTAILDRARKPLQAKRTAKGRRTAAPTSTSGHNPNTPILLYDTHPNQRFIIGEEVISVDPSDTPVKGIVLGHVAEDRLWVQWPDRITQEETAEVFPLREAQFFKRTDWEPDSLGDEYKEQVGIGNASASNQGQIKFFDRGKRLAFFNKMNSWMQNRSFQKELQKKHGGMDQAYTNYNLFSDPKVAQFLKQRGLSDNEIQNYGQLRARQLQKLSETQKQNPQQKLQWGQGTGLKFTPKSKQPTSVVPQPLMDVNVSGASPQPSKNINYAFPYPAPLPQVAASKRRIAAKIHRDSNLIEGLYGAKDEASIVRFAARVMDEYWQEIEQTGKISPTASKAARNATAAIIQATNNLRRSGLGGAAVAKALESNFLEALSIPKHLIASR